MDWITLARLLTTVGFEVTDFILRKQAAGSAPVSLAEWDELRALSAKTPQTQLADAIAHAGLSPSDPRVVALMDMLPGKT